MGAVGFTVALSAWVPALFLIVTLGLLLFPDGKLPSPRWRWVGRSAVLSIAVVTGFFAWEFRPWSATRLDVASAADFPIVPALGLFVVLATSLASVVALVRRSRGATGEARQQFRWVTWGFAMLAITTITVMPFSTDVYQIVSLPTIAILGVSYGVAIARYRLYEIDVVINRSLVFAVLAGFITSVYAVVVVGLGSWLDFGTSSLPLSIAATALVAVVFEPVRVRVQRVANRLVYGRRATPYQVLSDLTARLASTESVEGLLERMVRRLAEGTGAVRAALRLEGEELPAAVWPPGADMEATAGEFTVAIAGREGALGSVSILKGKGEALTPTERGLVEDLAGSAGMVLNKLRLDADLAARAEELRASRRRMVDAQGDERRRLERDLHDGAQQQIVALKVKLGLAARFAEDEDSADLSALIKQMAGDAQGAIEEIRSLAKGIFPPLLESDGLGAALRAGAANAPIPVIVASNDIARYDAESEAAAYFCISEAITNAVKYAESDRIDVELRSNEGGLEFLVSDHGVGFAPEDQSAGSGLVGMRDRLEALGGSLVVDSSPNTGTTVQGFLPALVAV